MEEAIYNKIWRK